MPDTQDKLDAFLADLTELSAKYGLGLTNGSIVIEMEHEDYAHGYAVDDEGALFRL